ncbi:MAG: BrnT family toxin [Lachnospiraceae bacterium]|nr:BrnT family toxin [Lachnospiraceae bacterium]
MKFEWDPDKNETNFKKHGVYFDEAETVFEDERAVTIYDSNHTDGEDRFKIIGISRKLRELIVCYCYRNGDDITRIYSARRATKNESRLYERGI